MKCMLGIDTSNYTTSLCAVRAEDGKMVAAERMLLPVAEGQRGLRQSDALFFHVRQLPLVMSSLMASIHRQGIQPEWVAVGASVRPRPHASSYMPVFQAGTSFGMVFAQAQGIPFVRTSHQEGHLAAAEYFVEDIDETFVAVHISGGTSDVMLAKRTAFGYKIDLLGEGLDLHAGQFVDRVGVHLGLPFPAGPALESLASTGQELEGFLLPSAVRGAAMSFSGPLSAAIRAIDAGVDGARIAAAVQQCLTVSVAKAVEHAVRSTNPSVTDVLIAGGVASNQWIRRQVTERLTRRLRGTRVQFAPPEFARDNALGVARIVHFRTSWR